MRGIRLDSICVKPEQSLAEAIACIEASGGQIALVIDEAGHLAGTITDGDVRRAILRGGTLATPASEVMNPKPKTAPLNTPAIEISARLAREEIAQMPLVDSAGRVVDVVFAEELKGPDLADHPVVIMAGGLGTRLHPITETVPKPMIPIGGRPILEIIIERFREQGFARFVLCVNHLAEVIEEHFGDGRRFDVEITYVREPKRLGTAGALSLIAPRPSLPMIVMNADILTAVNFAHLLAFHRDSLALATMGLNRFQYQLPYGVVEVKEAHIASFAEKPVFDFFVNAGIYVISPDALELVPADTFFDMPALFEKIPMSRRAAFPIHEYWLDIGKHDDLDRATRDYQIHFRGAEEAS